MNKFLFFIVLAISNTVMAQVVNIPTTNNYSELSNNFKGELGTGNFVFNVPLFNIETINPNFNLRGTLYYNTQAATSVFTAQGMFSKKGFAIDFLPTISRKIEEAHTLWDESYYKVNSADLPDNERPLRTNDLFEFDIYGLRGSFRLIYNSNNTIDIDLVDSNNYVEISGINMMHNSTGDAKIITLQGFTIKDKDGFSYHFNEVEESGSYQAPQNSSLYSHMSSVLDNPNNFNLYKKGFLLSEVVDKYGRSLVAYTYKTYPETLSYLDKTFNYAQKVIDKAEIRHKALFTFNSTQATVNSIDIMGYHGIVHQKVVFGPNGVGFYDLYNQMIKQYGFLYYPDVSSNANINNYGNYLKNGDCLDTSLIYNNEIQNYTAGLLKAVILPNKGKLEIEYETNTYYSGLAKYNQLNYEYVEVPVTSHSNNTYSFSFQGFTSSSPEAYYIKFNSQFYTDPLIVDENGNPVAFYPGIEITEQGNSTILQSFGFENQCGYGEAMTRKFGNTTIVIHPRQYFESYISNVKVYKKILKPENQWEKYLFGPSVRVKKITSIDYNNIVVNEQLYSYTVPGDDKKSSGKIGDHVWYSYPQPTFSSYNVLPVFYQYVGIEETGKGKTVYELNSDHYVSNKNAMNETAFQPKNIWKYNSSGQLTEHVSNEFEYFPNLGGSGKKQRIIKINSTIKTYEGSLFNQIHTEKAFDSITMNLTASKITEVAHNQVFEELFTYEKLGNAFYQTKVEKFKNNTPLNQSIFEYQQLGGTQIYNHIKTKVAKSNLPLEVEKEITLTDNYGNVLEYKTKNGMVVSQIWGYNDSKMVAELKNVPYSSISTAAINSIKMHSTVASYNEATLVATLNDLRTTHTNGFVTTYTYQPLLGVTSVTDANGRKESYVYDTHNRLYRVFNHEGLITKEYYYNIKN